MRSKGARGGRWLTVAGGFSFGLEEEERVLLHGVMDLFMIAGSLTSRAGCIAFGIPSCSKNVNLGSMLCNVSLKNCGDFLNLGELLLVPPRQVLNSLCRGRLWRALQDARVPAHGLPEPFPVRSKHERTTRGAP